MDSYVVSKTWGLAKLKCMIPMNNSSRFQLGLSYMLAH